MNERLLKNIAREEGIELTPEQITLVGAVLIVTIDAIKGQMMNCGDDWDAGLERAVSTLHELFGIKSE